MKPVSRSLLVRAIAYGIALLYLTLDLYVFNGPLHRQLGKVARPAAATGNGPASTAARVFGRDISLRAVDQQIILDAARGGRALDLSATDPATLFDLRLAALDTLITAICLDAKLTVRQDLFDPAATDAALRDAESLAGGPAALDARLAIAGLDRPALRDHLRAELARGRYLEERIAASGATTVTDEEIAGWLAAHPKLPELPAKVKLRHIFKASLRQDPAALLAGMTSVHAGLVAGTLDFATAALQSEDTSNKTNGGELGWIELLPDRLPAGIAPDFLASAPLGVPLPPVQSRLGLHVFLIDAREDARPATAAEWAAEARAWLTTTKRQHATRLILDALKAEGETLLFQSTLKSAPPAL